MSFFQNTCKPEGLGGKLMVNMMNSGHAALAEWGLRHAVVAKDAVMLDVGCGGGANLERLLKRAKQGRATGLDYSTVSVRKSQALNAAAIRAGRCEVVQGNVMELPFAADSFDLVTAFETIYFWPDLAEAFAQVYKVLKPGGQFLVCNEVDGSDPGVEKWTKKIEGMRLYNTEQLQMLLCQVGFTENRVDKDPRGWVCVTAKKRAE